MLVSQLVLLWLSKCKEMETEELSGRLFFEIIPVFTVLGNAKSLLTVTTYK